MTDGAPGVGQTGAMTSDTSHRPSEFIRTMADGTTKQINPLSGTEVWTVPGRGDRPLGVIPPDVRPITSIDRTTACAFCSTRYLETPPEKVRSVRVRPSAIDDADGSDDAGLHHASDEVVFRRLSNLTPDEVTSQPADFRRIPNLFEIMSVDYWEANHGYTPDERITARFDAYAAARGGREHLLQMARARFGRRAAGMSDDDLLAQAGDFFASTHDVIVARRHFVDGAMTSDQLASSGTLAYEEHREYIDLAVSGMQELYATNPFVRYVAVFQNWLKAAGASFDHLHKQIVGIDEFGTSTDLDIAAARRNPRVFEELIDYARGNDLVIAENDHAIAFAGYGHRYPSIEVWSTSGTCEPWRMSDDERHAMADLVHAMHAASGSDVPCNEEWHHRPPSVTGVEIPWHIVLKWRIANLAGFEGSTKIYLNTISPAGVRDRVAPALRRLRDERRLAPGIRL